MFCLTFPIIQREIENYNSSLDDSRRRADMLDEEVDNLKADITELENKVPALPPQQTSTDQYRPEQTITPPEQTSTTTRTDHKDHNRPVKTSIDQNRP